MHKKIVITTGLALFAMFFGAGNIIFPLELGAYAGTHIGYVMSAFIISGIGLPLLGLFATSLYKGDYWDFFSRFGRIPAFLLITLLMLTIGPLFAGPRTATVAFHSLEPFLPMGFDKQNIFSLFYCLLIFCLTYRHAKVIDIIGRIMSPIKLTLFIVLIVVGLMTVHPILINENSPMVSFTKGLEDGYSTMDLLATFFFCAIVCQNILNKIKVSGINDDTSVTKIFIQSCLVGGGLLAFVYIGFMLLALCHAAELKNVETADMIGAISNIVLGQFGSLFIGICVSFACMVTAMAVTEVTTLFFYEHVLRKKIPRVVCLMMIITSIYCMSIIGFSGIMKILLPILEVLYPALIIYCLVNIGIKLYELRKTQVVTVSCRVD